MHDEEIYFLRHSFLSFQILRYRASVETFSVEKVSHSRLRRLQHSLQLAQVLRDQVSSIQLSRRSFIQR